MSSALINLLWTYIVFIALVLVAGLYYMLVTRNLMRVLIGMELLMKAVSLLIILFGYLTGNSEFTQAVVIVVIVIEVVVVAITAGVILNIFRKNDSLDAREIRNLKG